MDISTNSMWWMDILDSCKTKQWLHIGKCALTVLIEMVNLVNPAADT